MKSCSSPLAPLLTPQEAAAILGVSHKTLAVWRCTKKRDLPYVKVGGRVMYDQEQVRAFIARNHLDLPEE